MTLEGPHDNCPRPHTARGDQLPASRLHTGVAYVMTNYTQSAVLDPRIVIKDPQKLGSCPWVLVPIEGHVRRAAARARAIAMVSRPLTGLVCPLISSSRRQLTVASHAASTSACCAPSTCWSASAAIPRPGGLDST